MKSIQLASSLDREEGNIKFKKVKLTLNIISLAPSVQRNFFGSRKFRRGIDPHIKGSSTLEISIVRENRGLSSSRSREEQLTLIHDSKLQRSRKREHSRAIVQDHSRGEGSSLVRHPRSWLFNFSRN
jgi:preprotein translocase subunit SecF